MAIQASGAVSISDIQSEFGGANPISLSEYYRNGGYVPPGATAIPTSGAIDISDFYGADNQFAFNITSDTAGADIRALAVTAGWDGATRLIANVNAGVTLYYGASLAGSFPSGVILVNSGNITGGGGSPGGGAGGNALNITTSDTVDITNNSGAFIAGGGGGGGGSQGGGGAGQALPGQAGQAGGTVVQPTTLSGSVLIHHSEAGSPCTASGSCTGYIRYNVASGGQQGAPGNSGSTGGTGCTATGSCSASDGSNTFTRSFNLGGPIYPNVGGQGGSILSATQNQTISGGGWGLAGSGGGAGGAAISGTYASLTDSGTIYGSV